MHRKELPMSENKERSLSEIINDLSKNVMFRLSLTSKELFHSNFLAWIFETYKRECSEVFGITELKDESTKIIREDNIGKNENGKKCIADIVIQNGSDKIIIENKFKCLPDLNQLKDYLICNPQKIILLSYFEPLFNNELENINCSYLSYKQLEGKLSELVKIINDQDNKIIIKNYIECLNLLNEIKNSIKLEDDITLGKMWDLITNNDIKTKLSAINFDKTMQRIYAIKLTNYILSDYDKRKILTVFIGCGRDLTVYSDIVFCYKNAWAKNEDEREKLNYLGVSVWGTNFRYYASLNNKKFSFNKNDREKGQNKLEQDYNWFFKNDKKWGGYCYDKEMYLYQKESIANLTLGKLKSKVHELLNIIYEKENKNFDL